jgi:hypothetical protein
MGWDAEEWSAFGQLVGAAGTVLAAGIAAYTARQARVAAQSSSAAARQASRALALHEVPKISGYIHNNIEDGSRSVAFYTVFRGDDMVSGTVTLRAGNIIDKRIDFTGSGTGQIPVMGYDSADLEFVDSASRRWRWSAISLGESAELFSDPAQMASWPLELIDP